jgi:predicted SnoaL-like aldol condensation-catalyzing enzyme
MSAAVRSAVEAFVKGGFVDGTIASGDVVASFGARPRTNLDAHVIVADGQRAALLSTYDDPDDPTRRFEGLDVFTVEDGTIVEVLQLTSTANDAKDPSVLAPTVDMAVGGDDDARRTANLELVERFYTELFGNGDPTAPDRYVAESYLQHNPWIGVGRQGLRDIVETTGPAPLPGLGSLGRIAEGDFVVNLSKLPFGDGFVLVDLFRVEGGMLAEHWDFTPLGTSLPAPPGAKAQ